MARLDEVTIHLIDETEHFALSYVGGLGLRELAADSATHIRAVWLSERPLDKKLQLISDMASYAQSIYFTAWWRKRQLLNDVAGLRALIEDASENRR